MYTIKSSRQRLSVGGTKESQEGVKKMKKMNETELKQLEQLRLIFEENLRVTEESMRDAKCVSFVYWYYAGKAIALGSLLIDFKCLRTKEELISVLNDYYIAKYRLLKESAEFDSKDYWIAFGKLDVAEYILSSLENLVKESTDDVEVMEVEEVREVGTVGFEDAEQKEPFYFEDKCKV